MKYVNKYSQYGEEEHILHVFDVLGIEKGHLVDLGAGDGYYLSNSRALLDRGWTGDLYDGDPKGAKDVKRAWIDRDSVGMPGLAILIGKEVDFLSIDIDGNDYWILDRVLEQRNTPLPSLIVCEINPIWQREEAVVMPYNEAHVWNNDTYYGMSLAACERLADEYGYTLMYLHHSLNAFLLRNDHAEKHPELLRPIEYQVKHNHRAHTPDKKWQRL